MLISHVFDFRYLQSGYAEVERQGPTRLPIFADVAQTDIMLCGSGRVLWILIYC